MTEQKLTEAQLAVLRLAARQPDTLLSTRAISEAAGHVRYWARDKLKALEKKGLVQQPAVGFWLVTEAGLATLKEGEADA